MLAIPRRTMPTAAVASVVSMLQVMQIAGSEITYPEPACYARLKFYNNQCPLVGWTFW